MFELLINDLSKKEEVKAIVLGGSRATGKFDLKSDYDIYVYTSKSIDENSRYLIFNPYVKYMEYSNNFWELEDDGILKNGIDIEIIYRDINSIETSLMNTIKGNISHGYSTCFLDNFLNSIVLYEEDHVITQIRKRLSQIDFSEMFDKIIIENMKLLRDYMPSIFYQIDKAMNRHDIISINHRLTEYFSIVFDILFALNKTMHPGEKRLMELSKSLELLPQDFEYLVTHIFDNAFIDSNKSRASLEILTRNIYQLVQDQNYNITYCSYEINHSL